MIFDARTNGDGQWHCPFSKEWLDEARRVVNAVLHGKAQEKEPSCKEFIAEPQDSRGVPIWWCEEYEERHKDWPTGCRATLDYGGRPEVVVTNGLYDWPL